MPAGSGHASPWRKIAAAAGASLLCAALGSAFAGGGRITRHAIEDLLAAGFSAATVENVIRETRFAVDLTDADLAALERAGLGDATLSFLRARAGAASSAPAAGRAQEAVALGAPGAPAVPYASSNLGPCLCGNDPLCVDYCLYFSRGGRGFLPRSFAYGGGGHFDHGFAGVVHLGGQPHAPHIHPGHGAGHHLAHGGAPHGAGARSGAHAGHGGGHGGHGGH